MKLPRFFLLCIFPLAALAATSDPVGALRLTLRGGSDTIVSLPLHRPALVEARLASRSGGDLALAADIPSFPAGGAYALIMSGELEGAVLPVTAVSDRTVSVDAGSYDLSSLHADSSAGDLVELIPYWTLDTIFPDGSGIHPSAGKLVADTEILFFDRSTSGTNQSASAIYFYFSGNGSHGAGWYLFGDLSTVRGDTPLPPNTYFVVRHPASSSDTELLVTGSVQMSRFRLPVETLEAGLDQDNFVALPVPVPITLSDSGLHESGAFADSPSKLVATDQLLVFDNNIVGQNKSASAIYFYFAGNGSHDAGWYPFGDLTQNANNLVLHPGEGYIVRKHATSPPESIAWETLPPYLQ